MSKSLVLRILHAPFVKGFYLPFSFSECFLLLWGCFLYLWDHLERFSW